MNKKAYEIKAVITGGAGFIGSHIADELVNRGWKTVIIDDLSSGNIDNINPILKANQAEFVKGNINDLSLLMKIFSGADYVFHHAAIASVQESIKEPLKSHETNVTGTLNVLLAARENKVKKVITASSSAVYGDTPGQYKKEEMIPNPQSPYAVHKLTGEYYCRIFNSLYDLPTACLRYFNVYGPRQRPDSDYAAVIPKFIQNLSKNNPPIVYGDGEQSRDFVFVKDVVSANLLIAENSATGTYNIGYGERLSINRLLEILVSQTNLHDIKPIYEKARPGDIKHSAADITKARGIGYKPEYALQEGLKQLITASG
jgi:UDP-glucose 4-epimerase